MKVYTSVVLLLLGSVFAIAIAAAGPISEASLKSMISEAVLSQEVQYNAGMQMNNLNLMRRPGSGNG